MHRLVILALVLVAGGGCTQASTQASPTVATVAPRPSPHTATTSAAPSPAQGTEPLPSPESGADPASPPSVADRPSISPIPGRDQQYRTPGVPDPTVAGPLTEHDLPNPVLGFRAVPAVPAEGEFNPNGTWVHAVDGPIAGVEAWPSCGIRAGVAPTSLHALAGRYADAAGAPGNALVLQFNSAVEARRYFDGYQAALGSCPREGTEYLVVTELTPGTDSYVARRRYTAGEEWSEFGRVREDKVLLVLLAGDVRPLGDLARAAQSA